MKPPGLNGGPPNRQQAKQSEALKAEEVPRDDQRAEASFNNGNDGEQSRKAWR